MKKKARGKRAQKRPEPIHVGFESPVVPVATRSAGPWPSILRQVLFFGAFYYYLGWIVEPHLIFHGNGTITNFPSFYKTWPFFVEHLSYPGGLGMYLSAFLSQWFYHSHIGALVIAVQAWGLCACIGYVLQAMRLGVLRGAGYAPAVLMAVLYGRYVYLLPTIQASFVALTLMCLYLAIVRRRTTLWLRPTCLVALSVTGYYLIDGAFLLFVVSVALYELLSERHWRLALLGLAGGAVLPYVVGVMIFGVSIIDAYTGSLPIHWRIAHVLVSYKRFVYTIYLLVPVLATLGGVVVMLRDRSRGHANSDARGEKTHSAKARGRLASLVSRYRNAAWLRWSVQTAVILAVGLAVVALTFDRKRKANFAVDYYAFHKMWPEVLEESTVDLLSPSIIHAVDRALYHTGHMGDEMFRWPQDPANLFLRQIKRRQTFWQSSDLYLDLGYVNMAEHLLTECLEGLGDRPMILQRLAWINMIKGNTETARVYLGALSQTLFHDRWARDCLDLLDRDPDLSTDEAIQQARSIALDKDEGFAVLPEETVLEWLLEKNGTNRMAFEYLVSSCLIKKQLNRFAELIQRCAEFGYPKMPRHFEEASLVYVYGMRKPLYLAGYPPTDEARRRVDDFSKTMARYGGNEQAAYSELAKRHRGSYFFYNTYGGQGKGR